MTRIFNDGAEMVDLKFWDGINNSPPTVESATPFVSEYYYEIKSGGARYVWRNLPAAISECYTRVRVRANALDTGHMFINFRTGGTNVAWVGMNALNQFIATVTTVGLVGTSAAVMVEDTWYLIEVYFKEANAPNGRFVVKVDENIVIDYTGDTQPAAVTTFDNVMYLCGGGGPLLIDDLALNDTNGAVDNSWCGDGIYVKVEPDGDGTHSNFHGSDGDDVNNYALCDEYPKDDDTTYVYHDNTSGVQQQFTLSHLSFTGYTILRLYAEARARKTASTAMTIKLGQLASGGSDVVSAGRALYVGSYNRVIGDDALVNPVDGNPWEEADIDALEFVAQVT